MSPLYLLTTFSDLFRHSAGPGTRVVPAIVIAVVFALLGYLSRGVTKFGATAGAIVAVLIYIALGLGGFVTLFAVFAVTWLTTRIGYSRKKQLGLAEDRHGRNAGQVISNVGAAAIFATLALFYRPFEFAAVAALAEAAADTASSEVGEALSMRAWMITNLRQVAPGTNGAISVAGTVAGIFAALVVALVAGATELFPLVTVPLVAAAGFLGTVVDSLLGATLENAHRIGNNTVNLLSTISAGLIALVIFV